MSFTYSPFTPYHPSTGSLAGPSPIYTLLIVGMVLFMAANVMPNLVPPADRVWHVAPMVLQWGFVIILFALMTQMLGLVPGVLQLHITYVHMTIATLLFILMWNHTVSQISPEPEVKRSSSSGSKERPPEKKEERKSKKEDETKPSPWDDLRAHPSAFLTTKLNRIMPWPFPMGMASRDGGELWWEKGFPNYVGYAVRPEPEVEQKADEEADKKKAKELEQAKAKEKAARAEDAEKIRQKEKAEKEAGARAKMKAEELKKVQEDAFRRQEQVAKQALEDRHKLKLQRTKHLAMIIGVSLLNKTVGFLLLLLFSLRLVSHEVNGGSVSQGVSSDSSTSLSRSSKSSSDPAEEEAKLSYMAERADEERVVSASDGSRSSLSKPSSSSGSAKESKTSSSSSSRSNQVSRSASSSSLKDDKDGRHPSRSSEVLAPGDSGMAVTVPSSVGLGMHYIHTPDPEKVDHLTLPSMTIPSERMAHPLMTSTCKGWAN